jgi:exonuclease III
MLLKLIVAGIYAPSANDDRESTVFYQEVRQNIEELQNTFRTSNLLLAGDFNAVLHPTDSSSELLTKCRTTDFLIKMIYDFYLVDMATKTHNTQHTLFRRNNNKI